MMVVERKEVKYRKTIVKAFYSNAINGKQT